MAKRKAAAERLLSAAEVSAMGAVADSAKLKEANKSLKSRIRELEKLTELQSSQLNTELSKPLNLKPTKRRKLRGKVWNRVIIPDTHGRSIDIPAFNALLADIEAIDPLEIVMLGDHIDCGGFLSQHHTMSYVAETEYSYAEDIQAANEALDSIQRVAPRAEIHYICGNHERRIEKWCVNETLRNHKDSDFLMQIFGPQSLLHLEARGIKFYNEPEFYHDLPVPGTIKLGKCFFTHGSSTAKNAASVMLKKFGGNVVFGHTHRMDMHVDKVVNVGTIAAWNPGCLCKPQPLWMNTNPTSWSHGYAVQQCHSDGSFRHNNVPIIDGVSYLISVNGE
jgi:predicted phosphodiesterase